MVDDCLELNDDCNDRAEEFIEEQREEDAEAFPPLLALAFFPHALEAFRR